MVVVFQLSRIGSAESGSCRPLPLQAGDRGEHGRVAMTKPVCWVPHSGPANQTGQQSVS